MNKILEVIGFGIGILLTALCMSFLVVGILALLVTWVLDFAFDIEFGFWKTFWVLWITGLIYNLLFKNNNKK